MCSSAPVSHDPSSALLFPHRLVSKENELRETIRDIVKDVLTQEEVPVFMPMLKKVVVEELRAQAEEVEKMILNGDFLQIFPSLPDDLEALKKLQELSMEESVEALTNTRTYAYPLLLKMFQKQVLRNVSVYDREHNISDAFQSLLSFFSTHLECFKQTFLKENEAFMLRALQEEPFFLEHALDHFKDNEEFVKVACMGNGLALQFAGPQCKNNAKIIRISCNMSGEALQYASSAFRNDRKAIVNLLAYLRPSKNNAQFAPLMTHAGEDVKNDASFIEEQMEHNPSLIFYAGPLLRKNKEFLFSILSKYPHLFGILEEETRNNKEIAWFALKGDWNTARQNIGNIGKDLQEDGEFLWEAYLFLKKSEGYANSFEYFPVKAKENKLFFQKAVENKCICRVFKFASLDLQTDRDLVKAFLEQGGAFSEINALFREDEELKLLAKQHKPRKKGSCIIL